MCLEESVEVLPDEVVDREALRKDGTGLPGYTQPQAEWALKGPKFQEYPGPDGVGTLRALAAQVLLSGYALGVEEFETTSNGLGAHALALKNVGGQVYVYDTVTGAWLRLLDYEQRVRELERAQAELPAHRQPAPARSRRIRWVARCMEALMDLPAGRVPQDFDPEALLRASDETIRAAVDGGRSRDPRSRSCCGRNTWQPAGLRLENWRAGCRSRRITLPRPRSKSGRVLPPFRKTKSRRYASRWRRRVPMRSGSPARWTNSPRTRPM